MTAEIVMEYPCVIPVKILGKNSEEFEKAVLQIVHEHFPHLTEGCLEQRKSGQGTYLALTITVKAESKEQMDKLYRSLTACPLVSVAL
jgi:putative lipoic acid-binding regulatory protein